MQQSEPASVLSSRRLHFFCSVVSSKSLLEDIRSHCTGKNVIYSAVKPLDKYHFFVRYPAVFSSIWVEKNDDGFAVIKAKIERLDISESSFCERPTNRPPAIPMESQATLTKAIRQTCKDCTKESLQVYQKTWMCLNLLPRRGPACSEAVAAQNSITATEKSQYDPRFMAERLDRKNIKIFDFEPPRPADILSNLSKQAKNENPLAELLRGIGCPRCNKCVRRVDLLGWKCDEKGCGYEVQMPIPIVPLQSALGNRNSSSTKTVSKYKIENADAVGGPQAGDFPGYDVMNFTFAADDRKWSLYVLTPTKETLKAPDGPDAQYLETLKLAHDGTLPLQRKPFSNS